MVHLGFLEYTRGPPHNVHTDVSLVSDHTYQWGFSVSYNVPTLSTVRVPPGPLNYNTPAMVLVNMSTRGVQVKTN